MLRAWHRARRGSSADTATFIAHAACCMPATAEPLLRAWLYDTNTPTPSPPAALGPDENQCRRGLLGTMWAARLDLTEVVQDDVDHWLAAGRSTRYEVGDFLVRAARRSHGPDLVVPVRPRPDPAALDEESHWEFLRQCLNDTASRSTSARPAHPDHRL